jgi:hypothetical protein
MTLAEAEVLALNTLKQVHALPPLFTCGNSNLLSLTLQYMCFASCRQDVKQVRKSISLSRAFDFQIECDLTVPTFKKSNVRPDGTHARVNSLLFAEEDRGVLLREEQSES